MKNALPKDLATAESIVSTTLAWLTSMGKSARSLFQGWLYLLLCGVLVSLGWTVDAIVGLFETVAVSYLALTAYLIWSAAKRYPLHIAIFMIYQFAHCWAYQDSLLRRIGRAFLWIPTKTFLLPLNLLWTMIKWLNPLSNVPKSRAGKHLERALPSWPCHTITASPPKNAVLEIVYDNGSHCGYGTCVRIEGEEKVCLLSAMHCISGFGTSVIGKSGTLCLDEFEVIYSDPVQDVIILRGPAGWNSLLGAKAVPLRSVGFLRKGSATLFQKRDGVWKAQTAKIQGIYDGKVSVLSQTEEGDSGLPYFVEGKVVAVHVGHFGKDLEANRAGFVHVIPGFTHPVGWAESMHQETHLLDLVDFDKAEGHTSTVRVMGRNMLFAVSDVKVTRGKSLAALKKEKWIRDDGWDSDDEDIDNFYVANLRDLKDQGYFDESAGWKKREAKPKKSGNGSTQTAASGKTKAAGVDNSEIKTPSTPTENSGKKSRRRRRKAGKKAEERAPESVEEPAMATPVTESSPKGPFPPPTDNFKTIETALIERILERIDLSKVEAAVVEALSSRAMKKPQKKRRRSKPSSAKSTNGSQTPAKEKVNLPKTSAGVASPKSATSMGLDSNSQPSGSKQQSFRPGWLPKSQASGGPSTGAMQN